MMKPFLYLLIVLSFSAHAQNIPGLYPQGSARLLTITDIQEMDEPELKLMRNEIFARYGYIFKSTDLSAHFSCQSWYKPVSTDVTSRLTDIEKKKCRPDQTPGTTHPHNG